MSLRAANVRVSISDHPYITRESSALIRQVDEEIAQAARGFRNAVQCTLPTVFTIPNVSNATAQRVIYYKLLQSLIQRGFDVRIIMNEKTTIYCISWLSEHDKKEQETQTQMLARYTTK